MALNDIYRSSKPLIVPPFAGTKVDVIIPFHGQESSVSRLIKSIWNATQSNSVHITLVDDASPNDGFVHEIERAKIPKMKVIRNETQQGFGASLFAGYKESGNPWVVFMHSDCVVEDIHWLLAMGQTYMSLRGEGVKMVSAKLSTYAGGDPRTKGNRMSKSKDIILEPKNLIDILENDMYIPMGCTLCHRDLFKHTGFIKPYPYGWYEDLEFGCRMYSQGFKQAISGSSWVHHEGGSTFNPLLKSNPKILEAVEGNFQRASRDIQRMGLN